MPLSSKSPEIHRLIEAFEIEANKFHEVDFHTFHITQSGASPDRRFHSRNHTIMLWQYYGGMVNDDAVAQLLANVGNSDSQWGVRGAELSHIGLIEGEACERFVRMANRAGSLFDKDETAIIKSRVVSEIQVREREANPESKPTAIVNDHPLAIWLNYLLYHLSLTYPGRERSQKIEPDPFSLSLMALERLVADQEITKVDRSTQKLEGLRFKVAMSFPGEKRRYVRRVVDALRQPLGEDSVFYDFDYKAQLARPNLDLLLQKIYRHKSDLLVVFLCAEYEEKEWCGLEWRAVRDIIKAREDDRVMFVKFDDADVRGVFSIDGYIDGTKHSAQELAKLIVERLDVSQPS